MSDHFLHLRFGAWGPEWTLTCHHEPDAWIGTEREQGGLRRVESQCWARSWWDDLTIDDVRWSGFDDVPLSFPLPVRPFYDDIDDGLTLAWDPPLPAPHWLDRVDCPTRTPGG